MMVRCNEKGGLLSGNPCIAAAIFVNREPGCTSHPLSLWDALRHPKARSTTPRKINDPIDDLHSSWQLGLFNIRLEPQEFIPRHIEPLRVGRVQSALSVASSSISR